MSRSSSMGSVGSGRKSRSSSGSGNHGGDGGIGATFIGSGADDYLPLLAERATGRRSRARRHSSFYYTDEVGRRRASSEGRRKVTTVAAALALCLSGVALVRSTDFLGDVVASLGRGRHLIEEGYAVPASFARGIRSSSTDKNEPFWIAYALQDGGLAPQMFQYASTLGMMLTNAADTGVGRSRALRLCYHIRPDAESAGMKFKLEDAFVGPFTSQCPPDVPGKVCGGKGCPNAHWEDGFGTHTPLNLDGPDGAGVPYANRPGAFVGRYLQSHRYFEDFEPAVRRMFQFRPEIQAEADGTLQGIVDARANVTEASASIVEEEKVEFVGIHFHREPHEGDLSDGSLRFPPDRYFELAMSRFEDDSNKSGTTTIFVVVASDADRAWIEANLPSFTARHHVSRTLEYVRPAGLAGDDDFRAPYELALLASCQHSIVTMGAFGWWGGWLSGGTVVYYRDQFNMDHEQYRHKGSRVSVGDRWPERWVGIGSAESYSSS